MINNDEVIIPKDLYHAILEYKKAYDIAAKTRLIPFVSGVELAESEGILRQCEISMVSILNREEEKRQKDREFQKRLLSPDPWKDIPKPDPEVTAKYDKAFDELNKALKESYPAFIEAERKHNAETAKKASEYFLG